VITNELLDRLLEFRRERDWEQFHSARNLSAALSVEAAELLAHFRWVREGAEQKILVEHRDEISNELADIAILLSYLCHDLGVTIEEAVAAKLEINRSRYPVEKSRGTAKKYTELE
jgi:dCTP diphosphatase